MISFMIPILGMLWKIIYLTAGIILISKKLNSLCWKEREFLSVVDVTTIKIIMYIRDYDIKQNRIQS